MVDTETCPFILRLMDTGGVILRRTGSSQGEYERIGALKHSPFHHKFINFSEVVYDDRTNHAEESAYIPRERHEFDDEQHVITLV